METMNFFAEFLVSQELAVKQDNNYVECAHIPMYISPTNKVDTAACGAISAKTS